jgi:DNA-directed RNA polymerase specialized sigma24 family protein
VLGPNPSWRGNFTGADNEGVDTDHTFGSDDEILSALAGDAASREKGTAMALEKYAPQIAGNLYYSFGTQLDEHDVITVIDDAMKTLWEITSANGVQIRFLAAFLKKIAQRRAHDLLRKRKSQTASTDSLDDETFLFDEPSGSDNPWDDLELQDRLAQLRKCIGRLVGIQKAYWEIQLRYYQNKEFKTDPDTILEELKTDGFPNATMESIKTCRREFRKRFKKLLAADEIE